LLRNQKELVKITIQGTHRAYQIRWVPKDQLLKHTNFLDRHEPPAVISENPRIFYYFTHWLFGRRIEKLPLDLTELVRAWILGQKYKARNFQNIIMDKILRNHRRGHQVLPKHVRMTYSRTRPESTLRMLVVDLYRDLDDGERASEEWRNFRETCDVDFLADVSGEGRREEGTSAMKRSSEYMV
jgi:hypothetical protein